MGQMGTEAWTTIGVIATIIAAFGGLAALMQSMLRDQTASIMSTMDTRFGFMDARFGSMEARFDALDARFDAIDARFGYEREHNDLRFNAIEHRLDVIESDMTIIKGALISTRSA